MQKNSALRAEEKGPKVLLGEVVKRKLQEYRFAKKKSPKDFLGEIVKRKLRKIVFRRIQKRKKSYRKLFFTALSG